MRLVRSGVCLLVAAALAAGACVSDPEARAPTAGDSPSPTVVSESPSPSPVSPSPSEAAGGRFDPDRIELGLRPVATGLESPLLVAEAGDGSGRLFVVERVGRVRVMTERLEPAPFLDISERVLSGGEQGLLGLAFHPEFESNGRLFVYYTATGGEQVLSEFGLARGGARADPDSERELLRMEDQYSNHNGGHLVFGADGYLYVGTGDGGSSGDPLDSGQSLETLLAKLLRIDVDERTGDAPYGIPPDNPFVDREGARPEIWAYGLRNPWRFSFDPQTGDLWIGDVGQNAFEEIDRMPGDEAGSNFGWNVMEGRECYSPRSGCDRSGLVLPVAVYDHALGCSVTGGFVYRGRRWPALRGVYLFSDYCSGTIWGLDARRPREPVVLLETGRSISSFGVDEAGELYVTDLDGGAVLRIVAPRA